MSTAAFSSTPTTIPSSDYKQQQPCQDNDDDISLANFISRKSQVTQQIPTMYSWVSPNYMALQLHQQDPWKENDMTPTNTNNYYGSHNVSYAHYQQLQYQQQYQKQHQMGYTGLSQKSQQHIHHYHTSGTNHRSTVRKTRPAPADTHHDSKTRMSPTTIPAPRVRSSTLNSSSSSSLATNASNSRQQQRQRSSSPVPSLVDDSSGTWRSSIYSHHSAASSSVKTTSDTTSFTNTSTTQSSASSISSFSMSTTTSGSINNNNKPSLTKRIRGVFSGGNKQHYDSYTSTLRRSPSLISCASSVMTTNTVSSTKSSWTNLFRKSSKSASTSSATHVQQDTSTILDHGKYCQVVAPASPASSISGRSQRHSTLRPKNAILADLQSPASSSSTTTNSVVATNTASCTSRPASIISSSSLSKQQHEGNGNKQIRSSSPKIDPSSSQQDYFGLPSSRHMTRPTFLQHGSPGLRPSSKNSTSLATNDDDDDDDVSTCMMVAPSNVTQRNPTTAKMAPPTFVSSGKKGAKARFNTTIQVHDTFGSKDYDRRCDTQVTCQRLTPVLALQIKQELNEYKLNEMVIHPSSRQYTQFFL